ncbi:hypothetical protein CVT25_010757, partial [Psilocybe cyanescens]
PHGRFNFLYVLACATHILVTPVIYDGRTHTKTHLDGSVDPFLTTLHCLRQNYLQRLFGTDECSLFSRFLPFLLSNLLLCRLTIAVFVPGGNPQFGFRRTDITAQKNWNSANLLPQMETGTTAFHFSIKLDEKKPPNYNHEY